MSDLSIIERLDEAFDQARASFSEAERALRELSFALNAKCEDPSVSEEERRETLKDAKVIWDAHVWLVEHYAQLDTHARDVREAT